MLVFLSTHWRAGYGEPGEGGEVDGEPGLSLYTQVNISKKISVGLTTSMLGGLGKLAILDSMGQEGDTGTATSGGDKVTRED